MNILELKANVTPLDVALRYLGRPLKERHGKMWYKSPFRTERTASFMVTKDGFHDFGDSWHGDIVSFVERYYALPFKSAVELLMSDFGIGENEYETPRIAKIKKQQREQQKQKQQEIHTWFNDTYEYLCRLRSAWEDIANEFKGEINSSAYSEALNKLCLIDYWLDVFMEYSDKKQVLYERRESVACSLM